MNKAERYEEHQRRVGEILDQAAANARRNMWRRWIAGTVGGTLGFVLLAGLADSALHHVPWNWQEAGIRAAIYLAANGVLWAGLMYWDYRTNPLRRR